VFVLPVSTGQAKYPTRNQSTSRVFRYDPATNNHGWHDSIDYPAAVDNPLNGNMYKPLYFDRGQAIHGANTVPTSPVSHGCVRMRNRDVVDLYGRVEVGTPVIVEP
jgi:lipoprotein-anchoring transpeptidase ErfK/SrfK